MVLGSPSAASASKLVFPTSHEADSTFSGVTDSNDPRETHECAYLILTSWLDMLKAVLAGEGHLFTLEELDCFRAWDGLPYNAKYLFCRLCLRKRDKWHRLSALNYHDELGSTEAILGGMDHLCSPLGQEDIKPKKEDLDASVSELLPTFHLSQEDVKPKLEPSEEDVKPKLEPSEPTLPREQPGPKPPGREVIDLTLDDEDEQPQAGPSRMSPECKPVLPAPALSQTPDLVDYSVFADNEDQAELAELMECLNAQELEELAKETKTTVRTKKRDVIIDAILRKSATQTTLPFAKISKKGKEPMVQTRLPWGSKPPPKSLRQTQLAFRPPGDSRGRQQEHIRIMVIKKLKRCIRINPHVVALFHRTNLIYFRSTRYDPDLLVPAVLAIAKRRTTPDIWRTREELLAYEAALATEAEVDVLLGDGSFAPYGAGARGRSTGSKTPAVGDVKEEQGESDREIMESIYQTWCTSSLRMETRRHGGRVWSVSTAVGHILTRVICKGTYALSVLKEFREEVRILQVLLEQTRWRRARRGRWYSRCALVLMHHLKEDEEAMDMVIAALRDPYTHLTVRPQLIPPEERHICEGSLETANAVYVEGTRIKHRAGSLVIDQGRVVNEVSQLSWKNRTLASPAKKTEVGWCPQEKPAKGVRSIWKGRDDEEVNVETFALQYYEAQGCRGFHCEGRIVTTLFGLLFWDVLFAPVAGAFETLYQAAPLDLPEDTFFESRQDIADAQEAVEVLEKAYDEHKDVICQGVRWDLFTKEDLLGIVRCIQPKALSTICCVMCEDYTSRTGGVPDLIVWHEEEGWARFVEVKGPGDTLQENQKVRAPTGRNARGPLPRPRARRAAQRQRKGQHQDAQEREDRRRRTEAQARFTEAQSLRHRVRRRS
ncbi:uncharacterized protein BXZ73DRAFT_86110 [Epithele typhae]|uniref:uncharacterized protein n=1 Tax=Epithele typhae TaxID=378194 RepID=UPI002008DAE4|nr:uncharacterized protein BXZ73DRAFT_86110 [Epithele typhae]KAH9945856.1 hypothetical protein BXZ73DRAFT_86110 [Epithele typhae]